MARTCVGFEQPASHMPRVPGASAFGRGLARRLARKVYVEDLGRISWSLGRATSRELRSEGAVLSLLALLLTRPDFSCTRDQVLDALWPDLEPDLAMNSLNQTIYFLRRVFEADLVDELSPGYLHHESEVIWLDPELVSSRSDECAEIIRNLPQRGYARSGRSSNRSCTQGRFALDFEYEDWAAPYRDTLHASYLQVVECALSGDLE